MRSLRSRLILSHILPLLVILPVAGFLLVNLIETQYLLANISTDITHQAVLAADVASSQPQIWFDSKAAEAFITRIGPRLTARMMLLDPEGRLVVSSDPIDQKAIGKALNLPSVEAAARTGQPIEKYNQSEILEVVVPVVALSGDVLGFVRMTNPYAEAYTRSVAFRNSVAWILAGALLIGILIGLFLANDLATRLNVATRSVIRMATSGASGQIKEDGPQEIRQLYRAYNLLASRLQTLEENRKKLLANLIHELGRSLGALQSGVQALIGGAIKEKPLRDELLEGMRDELLRLKRLVDDLSGLRDQITGALEMKFSIIDLNEWLPRVLAAYHSSAVEKGLLWEESIAADLPGIQVDADRIAQALGNLISNAIRYTPKGGCIGIMVDLADDDHIRFIVNDDGPGIPAEEKDLVFQPFYRGKSVKRFSDGMGLGLTIAREILNAHQGTLQITSQPDKGARFELIIPVKPSTESV
jgi:two-component system sensor histidine kinase BaeS